MSTSAEDRRGSLPRAYQRACLLILLAEGSAHGYELLEQVRGAGLAGAEAGGLYRCLRSMEEDGLVTSWWEPSQSGPPRRTYLLSVEGEEAAREWIAGLEEVRDHITGLLDRYAARSERAVR
ncbi:MAG: PadR family transcriptional regulator [Acidimicrobiales bacterium]